MRLKLSAKGDYDLRSVVFSHGWADLSPFRVGTEQGALRVGIRTSIGPVAVGVSPCPGGLLADSAVPLPSDAVESLKWMFRLDEDLDSLYEHCARKGRPWVGERRMGRLLRSQTVFEDLMKLICTTNCSWGLTRTMTDRLSAELGEEVDGLHLFPSAEVLARKAESFYRGVVRAGYRSPHFRSIAKAVLSGRLDPDRWRFWRGTSDELRREILSVPGAGPYVADNLLRLLGHLDRLGLDSWGRGRLKELWGMRRVPSDRTIERRYKEHGVFRGLVLWCDLTKDWLETGELASWIRRNGQRP